MCSIVNNEYKEIPDTNASKMLSKFHKNAIITGPLDAYCLVCEQCMSREDDIVVHIKQSDHIDKLKSTPYCVNFKEDCIRKVKRGYYCECCNILFPTLIKVRAHINEAQHINNKVHHIFTRTSQGVLAFDRILISEDAWNGFIDGNCFICNKNLQDNNVVHKLDGDHVLNLIESKVEFLDNSPYREAVHGYQCLICNEKVELGDSTLIAHFDEISHKIKLNPDNSINAVDTTNNVIEFNSAKAEEFKSKTYQLKDGVYTHFSPAENTTKTADSNNTKIAPQKSLRDKDDALCRINYMQKSATMPHQINCMVCQLTINELHYDFHINDKHHKTLVEMHRNRIERMCSELESVEESNNVQDKVDISRSKIIESLADFQNSGININLERDLAVCKKCSKTLSFKFEEIKAHIKEHNALAVKIEKTDTLNNVIENGTNGENKNTIVAVSIDNEDEDVLVPENIKEIFKNNQEIMENNIEIAENNVKKSENNTEIGEKNVEIVDNNEEIEENGEDLVENIDEIAEKNEGKAKNDEPITENNEIKSEKNIEIDENNGAIIENNEKEIEKNNKSTSENKVITVVDCEEIFENNEETIEIKDTIAKNSEDFADNSGETAENNAELAKELFLFQELDKTTLRKETQRYHDSNNKNGDRENTDIIENIELHSYIETLSVVKDVMTGIQFIPINDNIAVSFDSFFMIVLVNFKYYRCYLCETAFSVQEKRKHLETAQHSTDIVNVVVVTSLQSEFIREIRPGVYHCGVCNNIYSNWDCMKAHLNTARHKETKQNLMWFLHDSKMMI